MKPIDQWIAAVVASDWMSLPKEDLDRVLALEGLTGIDVRLARIDRPSPFERDLCARVLAAGKRLRVHGWTGVRGDDGNSKATYVDGLRQGKQLATSALALGAEAAGPNSERDVYRGPNGYANPRAANVVEGLADGIREVSPELVRIDVGLAMAAWHYKRADLDKDGDIDTDIPASVVGKYDRKGVMAYQVDDSPTIVEDAELRVALDRARKVWPAPMPLSVWLGVGRKDESGRVWGDYAAAREVIADRHAGIDEVVWYPGFGAIGQLLVGHPRHPSLAEIIPSIAQS